jgi:hypothetical protein
MRAMMTQGRVEVKHELSPVARAPRSSKKLPSEGHGSGKKNMALAFAVCGKWKDTVAQGEHLTSATIRQSDEPTNWQVKAR